MDTVGEQEIAQGSEKDLSNGAQVRTGWTYQQAGAA